MKRGQSHLISMVAYPIGPVSPIYWSSGKRWRATMDEGNTVIIIYLGFAKAFDFVNNRFLLAKMNSFGLGGVAVRWIEAYLSERVSRVHVCGELSGTILMRSSIPQGSVKSK